VNQSADVVLSVLTSRTGHIIVAGPPDPRRLRVAGCLAWAGPTVVAQQYSILYEKTLETQPGLNDALVTDSESETSAGFNSVSRTTIQVRLTQWPGQGRVRAAADRDSGSESDASD
jgi:hypothetical protein